MATQPCQSLQKHARVTTLPWERFQDQNHGSAWHLEDQILLQDQQRTS